MYKCFVVYDAHTYWFGIFTYFPVEDYLVALRVAQFQDLLLPVAGLVVNIYIGGDLAEIVVGSLMYNVLPAPRAFYRRLHRSTVLVDLHRVILEGAVARAADAVSTGLQGDAFYLIAVVLSTYWTQGSNGDGIRSIGHLGKV